MVDQLRTVVRERLSEAESVSDIVWLLETVEHMGAAEHKRRFVLEVQDRALQLVGSLPRSDVRLLVRTLARLKLRPTPLLQAAAFYLSKGPEVSVTPEKDTNEKNKFGCISKLPFYNIKKDLAETISG